MDNSVKIQYFDQFQVPAFEAHHQIISQQQNYATLVKIQQIQQPRITSYKSSLGRNANKTKELLAEAFCKLLDKYFISVSDEEFENFLEQAVRFQNTLINYKFEQEFLAAAFYYFYVDQIGIYNTKDFCYRNGLNAKKFNKKYKACVTYFKKQNQTQANGQSSSNSCKLQSIQQDEIKNKSTFENRLRICNGTQMKKPQKISQNLSPLEAIGLIYDFVFRTQYFQDNRRQIILKIVEKYEKTNQKIIAAIDWTDNPILKTYYIMMFYFRMYGASFRFPQAKEIVYERLKLNLTKDGLNATILLFKKFQKDQQSEDKTAYKLQQPKSSQFQ